MKGFSVRRGRPQTAIAAVALCLCGACGPAVSSQTAQPAPPAKPRLATVDVVGLTIAPTKPDGTPWDGLGRATPEIVREFALALAASDPRAALLALLATPVAAALEKPDVEATVTLNIVGTSFRQVAVLPNWRDSFTPSWNTSARWAHVPLVPQLRIRVHAIDKDLMEDDPIGDVELVLADLEAAATKGGVYQVRTTAQSASLAFVGVSVAVE